MKSATPRLPVDNVDPGADTLLLLISGLSARLRVPASAEAPLDMLLILLWLLKAGVPERLWYFLVIFTKVGGFVITLCCVAINADARACFMMSSDTANAEPEAVWRKTMHSFRRLETGLPQRRVYSSVYPQPPHLL